MKADLVVSESKTALKLRIQSSSINVDLKSRGRDGLG